MEQKSKQLNPIDFNSGQRRDLEKIIEDLRKDMIKSNNRKDSASPEPEHERPDSSPVQRGGLFRRRAGSFHNGLLGIAHKVPA